MNSKCADCGHEECRCDSPPMPAASPWRYDVENAPMDGSEVLVAVHDGANVICVVGPLADADLKLIDILAFATINTPETPND